MLQSYLGAFNCYLQSTEKALRLFTGRASLFLAQKVEALSG